MPVRRPANRLLAAHFPSACCSTHMLSLCNLSVLPRSPQVAVASHNVEVVVKYLLIEWLDGMRPKPDDFMQTP